MRTAVSAGLAGVVLFAGRGLAHAGAGVTHHHHGPMDGWVGVGAWVWMLLWLLVPVALLVGAFALFTRGRDSGGDDDALEVLRERYARGEIDQEEFDERREKLRRNG